jgi:single-stranded DNA-binding protein
MSVNLLVLVGRAGTDAELRLHPNGDGVCTFKLGTKRHRRTDSARRASESIGKGAQVYVEGRLAYRKGRENDFNVAIVLAHRVEVLTQAPNKSPTPVPAAEPDNPSRDGQVLTGHLGSDVPV